MQALGKGEAVSPTLTLGSIFAHVAQAAEQAPCKGEDGVSITSVGSNLWYDLGFVAQKESAPLIRGRSVVRIHPEPPIYREMAEWLMAPVLKTGVGNTTVGSNPTLSAKWKRGTAATAPASKTGIAREGIGSSSLPASAI